jgi:hypothetical protein
MLRVTQLCGFGSGSSPSLSALFIDNDVFYPPADISPWQTTMSVAMTNSSSGWNGQTMRQILAPPLFSLNGSQIRLVLQANGFTTDAMYIGEQAASGDTYDMKATSPAPAQIKVGGSGTFTVGTGVTVTTDALTFAFDKTKTYIVSYHISASSALRQSTGTTGAFPWNKASVNEAATPDVTGYNSGGTGNLHMITKIQVLS